MPRARCRIRSARGASRVNGEWLEAADPAPTSRTIDYDLPCVKCAYNLRGLAGDPLCCPECGHLNPVGVHGLPEPLVRRRLRSMERPLLMCVAAILFGLPCMVMAIVLSLPPTGSWDEMPCCLSAGGIAVLWWCVAAGEFRGSCRGKVGWLSLLVRYHVLGIGAAVLSLGIIIPAGVLWDPTGRGMRIWNFVVPAVACLCVIVGIKALIAPAYRRLMDSIHELQRERAIDELRAEARARVRVAHASGEKSD